MTYVALLLGSSDSDVNPYLILTVLSASGSWDGYVPGERNKQRRFHIFTYPNSSAACIIMSY